MTNYQIGQQVVYIDDFMPDTVETIHNITDGWVSFNDGSRGCIEVMIRPATETEIKLNKRIKPWDERKAFIHHMKSIGAPGFMFELDDDGNFDDMSMAYAWDAWQARAKMAPEGFVLMPKEPTQELFRTFYDAFNAYDGGNTAQYFKAGYRAMTQVKEQTP